MISTGYAQKRRTCLKATPNSLNILLFEAVAKFQLICAIIENELGFQGIYDGSVWAMQEHFVGNDAGRFP
jgi:uncharacterized membrane protein YtjA (UPF0391 family)